jgi:hypothetical protein
MLNCIPTRSARCTQPSSHGLTPLRQAVFGTLGHLLQPQARLSLAGVTVKLTDTTAHDLDFCSVLFSLTDCRVCLLVPASGPTALALALVLSIMHACTLTMLTPGTIALLGNWACMCYILFFVPMAWVLAQGVRPSGKPD